MDDPTRATGVTPVSGIDDGSTRSRRLRRPRRSVVHGAAAGPMAQWLEHWDARPDILADHTQREGERVWATAEDVMPGTPVPDGALVTAAWGESVWTATVQSDEHDPAILWLHPVTAPLGTPDVFRAYTAAGMADRVLAELGEQAVAGAGEQSEREEIRARIASVIAPVLADFDEAVAHHVREVRRTRLAVSSALDLLMGEGETKRFAKFLDSPTGRDLLGFARRYRVRSG